MYKLDHRAENIFKMETVIGEDLRHNVFFRVLGISSLSVFCHCPNKGDINKHLHY